MGEESILVLDLGSSSLKCGIFSLKGQALARARAPMSYFNPPGFSDIAFEFNPKEVWSRACGLVRECLSEARLRGEDISAVSTTGQRGGMALLGKDRRELYTGPNRDVRAFFEGMEIDERVGEQIYELTGHLPSFLFAPARLKWFKANVPNTADRIAHLLPLGDWLGFKLSGEIRGERSAVTELGLLPVSDTEAEDSVFSLMNIDPRLMPDLSYSGELVGEISSAAAADTGLAPGTPLIAGGPDTQCGLLGMRGTETAQLGIMAGWSGPLQMVTGVPCLDPERRTWTGRHIIENRWVLESSTAEAGRSLDWMVEAFDFDRSSLRFSPSESESTNAYTPFSFLGPRIMDAKALGMQMGGMLFPTPVGHTEISRRALADAVLKNLAFAIKGNIIQLEEVSGEMSLDISLGGGVIQVEGFTGLVSDTLGRDIVVPTERDVTLLGAAACAATGSGAYNSLPEAARAMGGETETLVPNKARTETLEEEYEAWLGLYERLADLTGSI